MCKCTVFVAGGEVKRGPVSETEYFHTVGDRANSIDCELLPYKNVL
jgi:hypothetical protein